MLMVLLVGTAAYGAGDASLQAQVEALQQRVLELEAQQSQEMVQQRNAELLRQMVSELASSPYRQAQDTGLTAGYDKGFFIKSADDQFMLKFGTLMQFRHSYLLSDDGDKNRDAEGLVPLMSGVPTVDSSGNAFELERARIYLKGHVLKDVNFRVQLELDDDSTDIGVLQEYEASYSFMPELGVRLGRYKLPFGKQETSSAGRLMMVDRSLANEVFNISRAVGVELFGQCPVMDNNIHYRMSVFNGFRDERNGTLAANDNNPAVAARLVMPLLGANPGDFANESDLKGYEQPAAQVGVSFAYANARTEDHFAGGSDTAYTVLAKNLDGRTDTFSAGGEVTMLGADVAYKCNGLSLILEGFYQHADLDSREIMSTGTFGTARDDMNGDRILDINGLELDNYGWNAQAGYFLIPGKFELVSRVGGVHTDNTNDCYEYAGGWNYYIAGQDLKLSMDVTYIDDLPIMSGAANYAGMQNNSLFMIRSQLQLQF